LTHMRRELMQPAAWSELLSHEEFMSAYRDGVLVECFDGILRRLFPRFFCYSADYVEKALLSSIRFLGQCPCPRCMVRKKGNIAMWRGF
ncbi:hypothetical protein BDZ89DRAFT_968764, partial [Hymenopellis radicata]